LDDGVGCAWGAFIPGMGIPGMCIPAGMLLMSCFFAGSVLRGAGLFLRVDALVFRFTFGFDFVFGGALLMPGILDMSCPSC
jgi:hypothetical protein